MSKKTPALQPWQVEDAKRLDRLYQGKKEKISQDKFGADFGLGTQGMVSQYLKARRPLNIKAAEAFARGLGVKIEEFSPNLAEQIKKAAGAVAVKDRKFSAETLKFAEKFERLGPEGRKQFERIYNIVQAEEANNGDDPSIPRPHPMRRKEDRRPSGGKQSDTNDGV